MSRVARIAAVSIARHRGPSVVAVATLALTLTALTVFVIVAYGLGSAAAGLESKANLVAYMKTDETRAGRTVLIRALDKRWPQASVTYVSPVQALRQFRTTSIGKSITGAIEGNPLPGSLDIRTPNPLTLNEISTYLSTRKAVTTVLLNRNLTNKLVKIGTLVTVGGVGLVLGLGFLALVMVVNTMHLSIEARKDEISVVRLMGGTQAFVRNPLLLEGVFLGLAGAVVATILGLGMFLPMVKASLAGSSTLSELLPISASIAFIAPLGFSILLAGAGVGAVGSLVAVRRFGAV